MAENSLGGVDNLGLGNNDGGVRLLIDWPVLPAEEAAAPDRRFVIAIYSRQTFSNPPAGSILAFPILEGWAEFSSWKTQPRYDTEPAATYKFEPGEGWKFFDITPLVRAQAKAGRNGHGVLFRFLNEDFLAAKETHSAFFLVSREGAGEWASRHPMLLVVKAAKPEKAPAK